MSEHNPFAAGDYSTGAGSFADDPNQHPQMRELIQLLAETRPWVRLFGVLMMIGAVLMLLGGGVMLIGGVAGGGQAASLVPLAVVYLIFAFLYVYPALCLNRYASAITESETTRQLSSVNNAILQQKKFWRFIGIITAAILIIYVLILIAGIVFGLARSR